MQEQKAFLLALKGYAADYMEMQYRCVDCRDTGYTKEGKKCHCFLRRQIRLLYAQSNMERVLEKENFTAFNEHYFDDTAVEPAIGMTVSQYMRQVRQQCMEFVEEFDQKGGNLLFTGTTGRERPF